MVVPSSGDLGDEQSDGSATAEGSRVLTRGTRARVAEGLQEEVLGCGCHSGVRGSARGFGGEDRRRFDIEGEVEHGEVEVRALAGRVELVIHRFTYGASGRVSRQERMEPRREDVSVAGGVVRGGDGAIAKDIIGGAETWDGEAKVVEESEAVVGGRDVRARVREGRVLSRTATILQH